MQGEFDGGSGEAVEGVKVSGLGWRGSIGLPVALSLAGAVFLDEGPVGGGESLDVFVEGLRFGEVAEGEPSGEVRWVGGEGEAGG